MQHPRRPLYPGRQPRAPAQTDYRGPDAARPSVAQEFVERLGETVLEVSQPPFLGWFPSVRDFDAFGGATLPANAASLTVVTSWRVPDAHNAVLWWWGAGCGDVAAWMQVRWQIRVNGAVVSGLDYDRVGSFVGLSQEKLCRLYVVALGGDTLTIAGQNFHATDDYDVCGRLKGWYWVERDGETR